MGSRGSTVKRALVVIGVAALVGFGWSGVRVWWAWGGIDRVGFDPDEARVALETTIPGAGTVPVDPFEEDDPGFEVEVTEYPAELAQAENTADDDGMSVYLIIGTDTRPSLGTSQRADAIMLFIIPADGSAPVLVSIPRDLYIPNPCSRSNTRINANLNGCGAVSGPEQLSIAIEDFTGVTIDHFALFGFDGFRNIVDRVGGVEVCTPAAVRDLNVEPVPLALPEGCSTADGAQALAWMRSRKTEGFVDGQWVRLATNDLTRNQRQQDVIVQALRRLSRMRDVSELTALVTELSDEFTIDENLSLSQAVSTAWSLRSIDLSTLARPVLPVAGYVDPEGRSVLVPRASFQSVVVEANPALAQYFVG